MLEPSRLACSWAYRITGRRIDEWFSLRAQVVTFWPAMQSFAALETLEVQAAIVDAPNLHHDGSRMSAGLGAHTSTIRQVGEPRTGTARGFDKARALRECGLAGARTRARPVCATLKPQTTLRAVRFAVELRGATRGKQQGIA